MKKLLLFLFTIPGIVAAQQQANKPVLCSDTERVIRTLTSMEYEERPIWMGVDNKDNTFSVFYNKETSGWTIIEFKGRTACVLGAGYESHLSQELSTKK